MTSDSQNVSKPACDSVTKNQSDDLAAHSLHWPELYRSLREIAAMHSAREPAMRILQTTSIVHEAYFRLRNQQSLQSSSQTEFLVAASATMRRVLIDEHRKNVALKRGGERQQSELSDTKLAVDDRRFEAIEIHDALKRLAEFSTEQSQALEMMIFGGATLNQIAEHMSLSVSTVERRIRMARAWLRKELCENDAANGIERRFGPGAGDD